MADQGATCSWLVPADEESIRLDVFARRCLPQLSRRSLHQAIREGLFRVGGKTAKKGMRLRGGDEMVFRGPSHWLAVRPLPNENLEVAIVYEDDAVLAVDKPAGMATHGFSGRQDSTLASFLTARCPELSSVGKKRWEPGLLHRLDVETSGLVLIAKTAAAHTDLERQFRRRSISKTYLALVWGNTAGRGVIEFPLTHDSRDRRRMAAIVGAARAKKGKIWQAVTRYRKLAGAGGFTLLEITMQTGVTHQIRAHLAAVGHPLVGDKLYGDPAAGTLGLNRHFLHAWKLAFAHPSDGRMIRIEADLPMELRGVLNRLGLEH